MSSEADRKPTLETVLERPAEFRSAVEARFDRVEYQLEQVDIGLDRLEGGTNKTSSEMMYLRADFKEFRSQFGQPA